MWDTDIRCNKYFVSEWTSGRTGSFEDLEIEENNGRAGDVVGPISAGRASFNLTRNFW